MAQGLWANAADGHICGRNRGRSDSTYGSPGAGAPAPEPVPAAAQRLPKFLWQPVWLIPPTLGQTWASVERPSERGQAEKPLRIRPLQSNLGGVKTALMKKNPSSEQAGRLDNTPKLGCYPDLYNHLFGPTLESDESKTKTRGNGCHTPWVCRAFRSAATED